MQINTFSSPPSEATSNTLSGLSDVLEKARIQGGVPGMSVVVVHKEEIIFAEGFGKRNETEPFTPNTLAPIASCTKAFTSAAIGELVAEGKMDWDKTPVNKYLPEFELKDPALTAELTLDDLLSHRTGIPDLGIRWLHAKEPRRELIKIFRHMDTPLRVRANWDYNNTIYAVAGEAGANIAGVSYEELVETKVLRPLGMTRSGFSPREMRKKAEYALPHSAASFEEAQKGHFTILPLEEIYMADAPAGDLHSSGLEMAIWARAMMKDGKLAGKQILNQESIERIKKPHILTPVRKDQPKEFGIAAYGLGWEIDTYRGHSLVHHGGALFGFRSNIATFPDDDLAVIVLTNASTTDLCTQAAYYIADQVLGLPKTQDWLFERNEKITRRHYQYSETKVEFPKKMEGKPAAHDLEAYTGDYNFNLYGDLAVREDEGVLKVQMREFRGQLEHLHFESFTTVMRDQAIHIPAQLIFKTGSEGKVTGLVVHMGDEEVAFVRK